MRWKFVQEPDESTVNSLAESLSIDKTLAKILVQRKVTNFEEAKRFFRPSLDHLHDPFAMCDMQKAVDRILLAIEQKENILIYGDYDVDGTTAVSLMYSYLKSKYPQVATYIPDRYAEGYGVSYKGIEFAEDNDFSLIIALDCGIKAIEKVAFASQKNIDFIICDHHKPGSEIPKAVAVLNPKREDCTYPYDELCGCGVGFKLIQALSVNFGETIEALIPYLDLVATAIAADIVPITGENRTLAFFGLQVINRSPRNGIKALIQQAKRSQLSITDVVFTIAPRINAAGRMKHGNAAVELLTEMNVEAAQHFAASIEHYNSERKSVDKKITTEALALIKELGEQDRYTTVVYDENWHKGVIGIVASRLIETYYRPTLVFTKSGDKLAASARSVKGFDVYEALSKCAEHIEQFGGHKYAAGLTLLPENYQAFKKAFENVVASSITDAQRVPEIIIDTEIELSDITPKFYRILKQMGPFGPQNMHPVFSTSGVRDNGYGKKIGKDQTHLKLQLLSGADKKTYPAIGFNMGKHWNAIRNELTIAYTVEENEWQGNTSLQLHLKDIFF